MYKQKTRLILMLAVGLQLVFNLSLSAQAKKKTAADKPATAVARTGKPNIVVIWGDDIGYWNVSASTWA